MAVSFIYFNVFQFSTQEPRCVVSLDQSARRERIPVCQQVLVWRSHIVGIICDAVSHSCFCAADDFEDQTDFLLIPSHQELLGDRAKDCEISVCIEQTGLEDRGHYVLSYVLFRCVYN